MGILTEDLTDERLEAMMRIRDSNGKKPFDITEYMMQRITSLELNLMYMEGYIAQLEFKIRKGIQ